jgi:hypothetical protein
MAESGTASPPVNIELNCLVFFGDPERLFTVKIANTNRVSNLKEEIRKKKGPELDRVPADALKLWKVSASCWGPKLLRTTSLWQVDMRLDVDNFDNWFNNLKLERANGIEKLDGRKSIYNYFTEVPNDEHLHIVAEVPAIGEFQ